MTVLTTTAPAASSASAGSSAPTGGRAGAARGGDTFAASLAAATQEHSGAPAPSSLSAESRVVREDSAVADETPGDDATSGDAAPGDTSPLVAESRAPGSGSATGNDPAAGAGETPAAGDGSAAAAGSDSYNHPVAPAGASDSNNSAAGEGEGNDSAVGEGDRTDADVDPAAGASDSNNSTVGGGVAADGDRADVGAEPAAGASGSNNSPVGVGGANGADGDPAAGASGSNNSADTKIRESSPITVRPGRSNAVGDEVAAGNVKLSAGGAQVASGPPAAGARQAELAVPADAALRGAPADGPAVPAERPAAGVEAAAVRGAEIPTVRTESVARAEPAPAPPPAPPPQQPLGSQLAGALGRLRTAPGGHHVLHIRVDPEDLGPVRVSAHIGTDGVRIELLGVTDAARDALRGALSELRRELAATGLQADLDLAAEEQPGESHKPDRPTARIGDPEATPSDAEPGSPTAPTRHGGLDLLA